MVKYLCGCESCQAQEAVTMPGLQILLFENPCSSSIIPCWPLCLLRKVSTADKLSHWCDPVKYRWTPDVICKPVLHCPWCKFRVIKPEIFSDIVISNMSCLALQAQSSVKLCHRSISSLGWLLFAFRLAVHWSCFQPVPPSKAKTAGTADTLCLHSAL